MNVEAWLRRRPRPAKLKLHLANSEQREMATVPVRSWAAVAKSVLALEPTLVEAFDASGALLRVITDDDMDELDGDADENDSADEAQDQTPSATRLALAANDAETQRFAMVAQIVADAYRDAANQGTVRTDAAFNRMIDLFDAVNQRAATQEKTLDHLIGLLNKQISRQLEELDEKQEAEGAEGTLLGALSTAFSGGVQQAKATNGAAGAPHANGKG